MKLYGFPLLILLATPALGQSCAVDLFEPNEDVASAPLITAGIYSGLTVGNQTNSYDRDFYSISIPDRMDLVVTTVSTGLLPAPDTIIVGPVISVGNLAIADPSPPNTIRATNLSGADRLLTIWVERFQPGCADYLLEVSVVPTIPICATTPEDAFEPNESILNPAVLTPGLYPNLFATVDNRDVFQVSVPPGFDLRVDTVIPPAMPQGGLWLELRAVDTPIPGFSRREDYDEVQTPGDFLGTTNTDAVTRDYLIIAEVRLDSGSPCQAYEMSVQVSPNSCGAQEDPYDTPDPEFDLNVNGPFPTPTLDELLNRSVRVQPGTLTGLSIRSRNWDFWVVQVESGITLTADLNFVHSAGDLDLVLTDRVTFPWAVVEAQSTSDNETVSFTNIEAYPVDVYLTVKLTDWVPGSSASTVWRYSAIDICSTYDLSLSLSAPPALARPFCFGNNPNTPCPCGNSAPMNLVSGCRNGMRPGATLSASSLPTVNPDRLKFDLVGAQPNSFSLLISADNATPLGCQATQTCGITGFDGLLCVGGNPLNHGVRAMTEFGLSSTSWENTASGFTAGQVRRFQVLYRTSPAMGCLTGVNSSNALEVTFTN